MTISTFGSKYFGWLAALGIVLALGWFLLPEGYNTLVLWLAPQLGNYIRPLLVMINILLVNPLNNITMVVVWAGAGFIGGVMAGTKKGAFVVGIMTWISCVLITVFCAFQLFMSGVEMGTLPPIPQGTSITDVLSIPLVQSMIDEVIGMIAGSSGGTPDISAILTPLLIYLLIPVVIVIVAGIVGAMVRPKE
ncbi:MAG: hypothetical protein R6V83_07300 [Candidatus Thorarchaeota archaeon]